jgi:hypothetical protein
METFLLLAVLLLIVIFLIVSGNFKKQISKLNETINNLQFEKNNLIEKNQELSRFQTILDAEEAATEIKKNAEVEAELLINEAKAENLLAKKTASEIKDKAFKDAASIKENAEFALLNASQVAKSIVDNANKKAVEIAGDAFAAINNAKEYEKTAKAMKNIIEGYGDQYIKPTYSLLDDLAEEFGHTEAGEQLKFARAKTNMMVKNYTAATCEYVEAYRRNTAITFVLDAFNGKVDSILSKVKKDNHGTLEQKILDSFQLVNHNGSAFRDAKITEAYLESRLDELKWAVIVQELKWQEQEEQRILKERIRDEERARREFEKAVKDAQKEEELLKKLIEKAQDQVSKASDEQRASFESKLAELEIKLKAAEEKNQRALSMAQQTKSGNVYIISNVGSFGENVYKIGMTRRLEPLERIKELGDASVPFDFDVHAMIYSENAPKLETELHRKFLMMQLNKVNPRKEFFRINVAEIKNEVERLGFTVKWTMVAEASHYRESKAIEEAILKDQNVKREWEKFQLAYEVEDIKELEDIQQN